jgi:HD-GYP domain-containing protein (c-di-GMP phosphodiesterase class II)
VKNSELTRARAQLLKFARDIRELYRKERHRTRQLEQALKQLNESYVSTMETLAFLIEAKDVGTRRHLDRTRDLAMALTAIVAPELAAKPETAHGFLLHDIGKVGIPESILTKPGPLSPAEWEVMRTHPDVGAQIVTPIRLLGDSVDVVRFHHERFDGGGYPSGLKGQAIPLAARIFSIVDAFDAITTDRPYRKAQTAEQALAEIQRFAGTQFDPELVEAFTLLAEADHTLLLPETHEQDQHDHAISTPPVILG